MKVRTTDLELYKKELNGEAESGTFYNTLYRESRENGSHQNAAKSVASRRWNLTNKVYWAQR